MSKQHSNFSRKLTLILTLAMPFSVGFANEENSNELAKSATLEFVQFNGNNISNWVGNNGHLASHIPTGDAGCQWPTVSGNSATYVSGICVAGIVDNELRTATSQYSTEWVPGIIPYNTETRLPVSESPLSTPEHQIYLIHRGNSSDHTSPNFNREYASWPASDGAPAHDGEFYTDLNQNGSHDTGESFEDFNLDGEYNPPDGLFTTGEDPPLFSGDHQAWWVTNDWDSTSHRPDWDTAPLGIEAHVLVYTRSDDSIYENVQFHQVTLVNKGGEFIEDAYYSYWSDGDIGKVDELGGCDSSLSLGYIYNGGAIDRDFGLTPPAVGYTILQGATEYSPGDTLWMSGEVYPDLKANDMTSFMLLPKHHPLFNFIASSEQLYFHMQGLDLEGNPIVDPQGQVTTYVFSGDPVTGQGWLARDEVWPYTMHDLISTGPFDLPPWDDLNGNGQPDFGEPGVQIIQSALIITAGTDHLDAITSLKHTTKKVHADFRSNFQPVRMNPPQLNTSANDQEIVLNWHENSETFESGIYDSYAFEGYNLYQGASPEGPWTRLATYDVPNGIGRIVESVMDEDGIVGPELVQVGDDTGLTHLLSITEDAWNESAPLVNNKLYHFAISAYGYNEDAFPRSLESIKTIVSVRPHLNRGGSAPRDSLAITQPGNSEIFIEVDVQDPAQLTGLDYEIGFDNDTSGSLGRWYLLRKGATSQDTLHWSDWFETLVRDWSHRYGYRDEVPSYYFDGFELSLSDILFQAPRYNHHWEQTVNLEGSQSVSIELLAVSPGGVDSLAWTDESMTAMVHMDTLYGPDFYYDYFEIEERSDGSYFTLYVEHDHDVTIQAFAHGFGAINGDRLADIPNVGGGSTDTEFLQSDLEIRFTETGQKATKYQRYMADTLITVPFEVWDIERNMQLCLAIKDNNKTGGIQDTSRDGWENTLDLDWVIVFDKNYALYANELDSMRDNPNSGWAWMFNDESRFSEGDVLSLHFLNPVDPGVDTYQWTTADLSSSYDQEALKHIQVFPNPYYGYHTDQASYTEPFVTFSNLPEEACTLRIYSLGGHLVKRIDHEIGIYENWDLLNEHRHAVASGIYIVHVEVPELGNKILKLAVFQPEW